MPLGKLPTATSEEKKERTDDKTPLKIRISLFFDGTMNNRFNIEEREKGAKESTIYADNKTDDANSYDNGRTNIAIMEPHVSIKKSDYAGDYDLVYKHYIPGQGAITREKDSVWGYALAIGESGVPWRAEEGIREAVNFILSAKEKEIDPLKHYIEKLTIDVFGFSRGAATARYAIHVLFDGRIAGVDEDTGEVRYEWRPASERINKFVDIDKNAVEVRFAGLYDTVLSYFGSQKVDSWYDTVLSYFGRQKVEWMADALQQTAVKRAKKSMHLAAADEHRADFPLHTIQSAIKAGTGEEYYLPGVHSDVGGSYNQASEKALKEEKDESKKVYMLSSNEGLMIEEGYLTGKAMVIHRGGDLARIEKDRDNLIEQGWYKINEIKITATTTGADGDRTEYALTVRRQGISSAYCNIPLKIMAKRARKPDVNLKISAELEDMADKILKADADKANLEKLEEIINNYVDTNKNSNPEDWLGDNPPLEKEKLKAIRHKHFHFSASKLSAGYEPRFEKDKASGEFVRRRYYYEDA